MFEKESKEYVNKQKPQFKIFGVVSDDVEYAYQHGALDVYNKLNNWHDLIKNSDDLPKENMKQVIVGLSDGSYEMGYYCIHNKTWWNNDCPDYDDELGYYDLKNDVHVYPIKWKEII